MKFSQLSSVCLFVGTNLVPSLSAEGTGATSQEFHGTFSNVDALFNKTFQLRQKRPPQGLGRSSGGTGVPLNLHHLQKYGCWCYFGNQHGAGKGEPVDAFDGHCQKFHHAVTCAKREIPGCDPGNVSYNVAATASSNGRIVYDCETNNNECQAATCYAHSHFVSLVTEETLGNLQLPNYPAFSAQQSKGDFDHSTCHTSIFRGIERDEICCGTWQHNTKKPIRFSKQVTRACCEKHDGTFKTYDDNVMCCQNGEIKMLGLC